MVWDAVFNILLMTGQLVAILNPLGAITVISVITSGMDQREIERIHRLVGTAVPTLMVSFGLGGKYMLDALGVDLDAFRVAGGVLLMVIAVDTLRTGTPKAMEVEAEDIVLVPVVTPLLVGPGTITTLILLSATYPTYQVVVASLISAAVVYVTIRYSQLLLKFLGRSFVKLLGRFMSLIIAAVAAEMILMGAKNFMSPLP